MGPAVRKSPSRLWGLVRQKVFHKRPSTPSDQLTYLSDSLSTNEELCRVKAEQENSMDSYSQSMMEKERKKMQALAQQRSDSTDVSYHSAVSQLQSLEINLTKVQLMIPERPALPFTISAPEWNVYSSAVKYLEIQIDEAQEWLASVLRVFTKVYTISKIFVMILRHYGVEVRRKHSQGPVAECRRCSTDCGLAR